MDDGKADSDRPAQENQEIEVTPAMLEAGALELVSFDPGWTNSREIAEAVFRAMIQASRSSVAVSGKVPQHSRSVGLRHLEPQ